jgi:DNA-3-methyladenine glycosylase
MRRPARLAWRRSVDLSSVVQMAEQSASRRIITAMRITAAPRRLRRSELPIDTATLARFLIGKTLVREHPAGRISGRIVETEAYVVGDAACHAFGGITPRNRALFMDRGHAYVYFIYGCWHALNVCGETPGVGAGVLVRSIEPLEGIEIMRARRRVDREVDLARGPGRLATALAIDRSLNGVDLCAEGPLWLGTAIRPPGRIGRSPRIGLSREAERKLRFFERDNAFVSGTRGLNGHARP